MASFYTVVRFVPSALAEEFVNVGVISFGNGRLLGSFLEDWRRVEKFSDAQSLAHVQDFQNWVEQSSADGGSSGTLSAPLDESTLRKICREWCGSIQLTEPRASLLDADALLEEIREVFLVEPRQGERGPSKTRVVHAVKNALLAAFKNAPSHVSIQTHRVLPAAVRPRVFDVVIANGTPRHAAQCFNFKVVNTKRVLESVDAAAYSFVDVRKRVSLGITAVVSPPENEKDASFDQALLTFSDIGVPVVQERDVVNWAMSLVPSFRVTVP